MTTTSTFIGFDENAKVSSRVLKPPGGGSSISFGDDDPMPITKSKAAAAAAPAPEAPKAETPKEAPKIPESPAEDSKEAPKETSDSDTGTKVKPVVDDFPPICVKPISNELSSNGNDIPNDPPATNGDTNGKVNGSNTEVVNGTSETNGSHSNGVSAEVVSNGSSNGACDAKVNPEPVEKSLKVVCPPPSSNGSPQSPTSPGATSPRASSGANSPDTKDRLFGATTTATKPHVARVTPSNHHMRSSIFHDELASCKTETSPVKESPKSPEKPKPVPQQPPHRVRQPPGGFSSQLW